ncbi:hypothetical protein D6C41_18815, partial [Shigella sonnei]|nr:hypothetical protein [Shigella sonnei]
TRGCNPAYSKSIHTWLRFGEIMRGSLSALREVSHCQKKTPERYYFAILIAPVFINKKETMK